MLRYYISYSRDPADAECFFCTELKICGLTNGTEGMAELQVERIDRHLVTNRQHSHGGEVAGRVSYICTSCHTGQTEGGTWRAETQCVNGVSEKY